MTTRRDPSECVGCRFAKWERTASGKLHPSGDGRCQHPVFTMPPLLPMSAYLLGGSMLPAGGHISRRGIHGRTCPTREAE